MPKLTGTGDLLRIARQGRILVFTNGCFDLLHPGHIHLLCEARKLGDILVVGLNSDASVKRLKGENRPVENEALRAQRLAELPEVDHIVIFSDETPVSLIEAIRPDVLVKGGDYTEDTIVGARYVKSYGGRVVVIPLLDGFSTTRKLEGR